MNNFLYSFFKTVNLIHEFSFYANCFYNRATPLECSASVINYCIDSSSNLSPYEKEYNKYCVNLSKDFLS